MGLTSLQHSCWTCLKSGKRWKGPNYKLC